MYQQRVKELRDSISDDNKRLKYLKERLREEEEEEKNYNQKTKADFQSRIVVVDGWNVKNEWEKYQTWRETE